MSDIPPFPADDAEAIPAFPSGGKKAGTSVDPKTLPGYEPPFSLHDTIQSLFGFGAGKSRTGGQTAPLVGDDEKLTGKQQSARNLLSAGDMVLSTPGMVIASGEDLLARGLTQANPEATHEQISAAGNRAYDQVMDKIGSPLHKVLKFAGIGNESGRDEESNIDKLMGRAEELVSSGGETIAHKTGGAINSDDVKSVFHAAMALAGGKGLKEGMAKLVARAPTVTADAMKSVPEVERAAAYKEAQDAQEKTPTAPSEAAQQTSQAATEAQVAKTRLVASKDLVLDPITGTLSEKVPEMGKEFPKPTSLERALDKAAAGRRFDMTAEERVALKGLMDKPLDKPIVDEQGKILDQQAFAKARGYKNSQRGSIELGVPEFIRRWAQGTKIATDKGEPKQVFHGTQEQFDKFSEDEIGNGDGHGDWGEGFYFTDNPKAANTYAEGSGGNVRPAYLRMKNPATLEDLKTDPELRDAMGDYGFEGLLKKKGFDGVDIKHSDGSHEYVVYDTKQIHGRFSREAGSIDPKLMARLAAVGLGAWAGAYFDSDDQLEGALTGGALALGASAIPVRRAIDTFKKLVGEDTRIKINELADAHEKYTKLAAVDVWSLQKQIEELVPDVAGRERITHAIEAGNVAGLAANEIKAAKIVQDYFTGIGEVASLEGVLSSARENYVTHIWDWSKNKGLFERWMDRNGTGPGMGVHNRFADARSIPTITAGKAQGLTPLTEDVSAIMGIYGNSMSRSIANSVFTRALKEEKVPGTNLGLVVKAEDAPHSYVSINNPAMQGLKVHPDIAPSLKMLYDVSSPGAAMKILQGISDSSKRVAVGFSLFHAKALTDAMIGGSSNPFKAVGRIPGFVMGTNKYLQELRKGSASDLVDLAAEGGLKFSLEGENSVVEDTGNSFYSAMTSVQEGLDKMIPHAGLPVKGIIEMNKKIDTVMWARLHAGMKLNMFAEKYQQLMDNAAKAAQKDPTKALTREQAARIAASYTNDLFGGLNWRRVAEDSKSYFGRQLGQAMLNPGARRVLGILMFAPDWTISTTRAAVKAFGKPDFLAPKTLAGLHQQYLIRSALYYLVVGDAINYTMSGHHLWDNKDPTVLDMDSKGERHMQWSKHTMEPVHWLTKPAQQAINKLGMIPRESIEQALNVDYLSAKGRMAPMESRVKHLAKNFLPISAQQADQGGAASLVSGFAGVPIYGKTAEQKKKDREERRKKRLKEHRK